MTTNNASTTPGASSGFLRSIGIPRRSRQARQLNSSVAYACLVLVLGLLCSVVWHGVVELPAYTINEDGSAQTTERGLTQFAGVDVWFVVFGMIAGLILGWLAWRWFNHLGWRVVFIALAGGLLAGLICWRVGTWLGPSNFAVRISEAHQGDQVPIDFALRTGTAWLVWPFAAVLPILIHSSLTRESDASNGSRLPPRRAAVSGEQISEPGPQQPSEIAGPKLDAESPSTPGNEDGGPSQS